jgi:iron complex transport system substrate-binding protein
MASKREGDIGVSVIATAADDEGNTCDHAESAGEPIDAQVADEGTINIIVVIDGNPTDSCLVSSIITATEAKTAAMLELDIRSRYSGERATGTITDAMVVAETGRGEQIWFGGPASKLGQLVSSCTRQAVKEAIMKGRECSPHRSLTARLSARHLPVEKLAEELAKVEKLHATKSQLAQDISNMIRTEPLAASILLSAVKLDEDVQSGLVAPELGDVAKASKRFGAMINKQFGENCSAVEVAENELADVDLPVFMKHALFALLEKRVS